MRPLQTGFRLAQVGENGGWILLGKCASNFRTHSYAAASQEYVKFYFSVWTSHRAKIHITFLQTKSLLYTITVCHFFVTKYSVWYFILFRETVVVHQTTYSFNYFFFTFCFIYSIYCG